MYIIGYWSRNSPFTNCTSAVDLGDLVNISCEDALSYSGIDTLGLMKYARKHKYLFPGMCGPLLPLPG